VVFGDLADKRAALKLTFDGRIRYKRNEGHRTAKAGVPFIIFNRLDCEDSEESEMVPQAGLEPALLSEQDFESSASTNSTTGAQLHGTNPTKRRFL
jgi:site-specific DNA recombinase